MSYIIAIIAIVVIGVGFTLFQSQKSTEVEVATAPTQEIVTQEIEASPTPEQVTPTEPTTNPTTAESDYADGTYTANVTYLTPKRDEYGVAVSLTLTKDIVTGAKVTYSNGAENDPNAAKFEAAYKAQVIGKDIDSLNLSRVGGASLTTGAFNDALVKIKADAQS